MSEPRQTVQQELLGHRRQWSTTRTASTFEQIQVMEEIAQFIGAETGQMTQLRIRPRHVTNRTIYSATTATSSITAAASKSESSSVDIKQDPPGNGRVEGLPDDIIKIILERANLSVAHVSRLKTVNKRWKRILESVDWRQSYDKLSYPNSSCTLKYQWCSIDGNRGRILFYCPVEDKWFKFPGSPGIIEGRDWELVATDGGLLCYQNASKTAQLCVGNPLIGTFSMLPLLPVNKVNRNQGQIVRLVVDAETESLKVLVTMFTTDTTEAVLESTAVFDSLCPSQAWSLFYRQPSEISCLRPDTKSFLRGSILYFFTPGQWIHDSAEPISMMRAITFDIKSGVWGEADIDMPCSRTAPFTVFESNGAVYVMGCSTLSNAVKIWQQKSGDFAGPTPSMWTDLVIMPTILVDKLYVGRTYSDRHWMYFSFPQTNSVGVVSVRHRSGNWFTYNILTREWKSMPPIGRYPNKFHTWFSWEPKLALDILNCRLAGSETSSSPVL